MAFRVQTVEWTGDGGTGTRKIATDFEPKFVFASSDSIASAPVYFFTTDTVADGRVADADANGYVTTVVPTGAMPSDGFNIDKAGALNTNTETYQAVVFGGSDVYTDKYTGDGGGDRTVTVSGMTGVTPDFSTILQENDWPHHRMRTVASAGTSRPYAQVGEVSSEITGEGSGTVDVGTTANGNGNDYYLVCFGPVSSSFAGYGRYTGNGSDAQTVKASGGDINLDAGTIADTPIVAMCFRRDENTQGCFTTDKFDADSSKPFRDQDALSNRIESLQSDGITVGTNIQVNANTSVYLIGTFADEGAGGQTISVGLSAETNTALVPGRLKTGQLGLSAEVASAFAVGRSKTVQLALAAEADSALATTAAKARAAGLASETDLAFAIAKAKLKALGLSTEADAALTARPVRTIPAGLASSPEIAQLVQRLKAAAVGQAVSPEIGQAVAAQRLVSAGLGEEADSAFALSVSKLRALGLAESTELANALSRLKTASLGIGLEADVALAVTTGSSILVGLASESDISQPINRLKLLAAGIATSPEAALTIARSKLAAVGLASSAELGRSIQVVRALPLGLGAEVDSAFALGKAKAAVIAIAVEDGAALAIVAVGGLPEVGLFFDVAVVPAIDFEVAVADELDFDVAVKPAIDMDPKVN